MSFEKAINDPEVTRLRNRLLKMLDVPRGRQYHKAVKRVVKEMKHVTEVIDAAFRKNGVKVELGEDLAKRYEDTSTKEVPKLADGEEAEATSKSQAKRVKIQQAA